MDMCVSWNKWAFYKISSLFACDAWQKVEVNGVLARNVEFSQLVVDYQRKLRETSESLNAAQELSRKQAMEVEVILDVVNDVDPCS